jgi:hypothetical protein
VLRLVPSAPVLEVGLYDLLLLDHVGVVQSLQEQLVSAAWLARSEKLTVLLPATRGVSPAKSVVRIRPAL